MPRPLSLACLVLVTAIAGCSRVSSAASPTAPTAGRNLPTVNRLRAFVTDTGARVLAGVRVEILDGPARGHADVTAADGTVTFSGVFDQDTRFQASKDGYETLTGTWRCSVPTCPSNGNPFLYFSLRPLAAPLDLAGDHTMTVTADPSCASLPFAARARSYPVTLTKRFRDGTADLLGYDGEIHDDRVLAPLRRFGVNVAANYMSIFFWRGEGEMPGLIEQLGDHEYVMLTASVGATVSPGTSLSILFDGAVEYLTTGTPLTGAFGEPIVAASRTTCTSHEHRLTLVRR